MFASLSDPHVWASFLTLTIMEIILGIDNLVFIAILSGRLPPHQQKKARFIGLSLALLMRLIFLAGVYYIVHLVEPVFTVFGSAFSWRDLIFIGGGLFLLIKGTTEIHEMIEGDSEKHTKQFAIFSMVIAQIVIFDLIFSIDSIMTAVGLTDLYWIMAAAIFIAIMAMMFAANPLSNLIEEYPTIKMLALSFLLLIGIMLIADGFHYHIPRGYLYFAIFFSLAVEFLNNVFRRKRKK